MKNTIRYCVEYQKYSDQHDSSESWGQLYFKTLEDAKSKLKELNNYGDRIYIEDFYIQAFQIYVLRLALKTL